MHTPFRRFQRGCFGLIAARLAIESVFAASWITPSFSPGTEPEYKPVPLYWFEVKPTPFAFRKIVEVKPGLQWAVAGARSSGYLYVFVDGQPVFQFAPREGTKFGSEPLFEIDLTASLTPGRHALVVSAPREGFLLDGMLQYANEKVSVATDSSWEVRKFPPTVILEDEPWLRPALSERGAAVGVRAVRPGEFDLERIAIRSNARRAVSQFDDTIWQLGLLAHRGIVIHDGRALGWGGAGRLNPGIFKQVDEQYGRLMALSSRVDRWRTTIATESTTNLAHVAKEIQQAAEKTEILSRQQQLLDERTAMTLARTAIPDQSFRPLPRPGTVGTRLELDSISKRFEEERHRLAQQWGEPFNLLNESRHDRLGWLPHPELVDSQMGAWGLRVNPITAPTLVKLDGKNWRFSPDPNNTGESEKRQTLGYNIENQWPSIAVPRAWNSLEAFKNFRGAAWYRTRFHIPSEWQNHNAVLRFEAADGDQVWLNDDVIGATAVPGIRAYSIDKRLVRAGAENLLVFKVTSGGDQRGLIGSVTIACPDLEGQVSDAPSAQVLATPLSPAVLLMARGNVLEIQGWTERKMPGPRELIWPAKGARPLRRVGPQENYEMNRDGKFAANWMVLWFAPSADAASDRPVMLVFERQPWGVGNDGNTVRITFAKPGARMVAVRPWTKGIPGIGSDEFGRKISFWQRAALAFPVNYLSLTRTLSSGPPSTFPFSTTNLPPGPVREHTLAYDYIVLKDDWGTKPMRIAPMPSMGSYAMDRGFRGLQFKTKVPELVQDGGLLGPYRALIGADRISYSYPIEPFPRLIGFTSWMFAGSDTGVLGNEREVELLKTSGANSYRPQHNFNSEMSPHFRNDARTRVQIMADFCRATGLNYMNNIDQTLGARREFVQTNYTAFMERVNRHYEGIARQLHDRPFFEVAYDLVNEPFDHKHAAYNRAMKELTARVRAIDPVHLLYIEPCEAWGAIEQLKLVEPTGDPLTVYSFHDYNFRLFKPTDRWPTEERDLSNICRQWTETFKFAIDHGAAMHCGEFGGFDNSTDNQLAQLTLMNDFFRIFDQFDMHFHYYSGRSVMGRRADGSMAHSNVIRAYRKYLEVPAPH